MQGGHLIGAKINSVTRRGDNLVEINWNIFKAKFNGKEQKTFENLCYLLFCDEFNQDSGIFRYKNQAGIETEPIEHEGVFIGFQAKFYETKVSENVQDIKNSIERAKSKNPSLKKILFYISEEFAESSKKTQKEPQYKINIEEFAAANEIEIVWRVPSHFERQLSLDRNLSLTKRFFTIGKSPYDLIQELIQHADSILRPIQSSIVFMGNEIRLDRSATMSDLKSSLTESTIVILSGKGGVGKTAVIKDFYQQEKETIPIFVFKAAEFNIPSINNLFNTYGNFTLNEFISENRGIEEKYIIIDSAEKLSDMENTEILQEFLSALISSKWKIIITTRHSYLDDLKFQLLEVYGISFKTLNTEEIKRKELITLSDNHCFSLPQNERLLELLQNPFYLSEYLRNYESIERSASFTDFKNTLWNKKIMKTSSRKLNIHIRRENCFLQIAQERATEGHFYVGAGGYDMEALQNLQDDEIIEYDVHAGGYFITHDIYEEWALDRLIERNYATRSDYNCFFESLGSNLSIRRAFRNWLTEKLFVSQSDIKSFIEQSINDEKIAAFWKDEIFVSVLLSEYSHVFFEIFEEKLLENNQELLIRLVFLLRIACKDVDEEFLSLIGLDKANRSTVPILFTKPKGSGWGSSINFIHKHKDKLGNTHLSTILPLLVDWNNRNIQGETTKKASQIGLFYYENNVVGGGFGYGFDKESKEQLFKVILQGTAEIKEQLIHIFDGVLTRKKPDHNDRDHELVVKILTSLTGTIEVIKNLPEYVIKLAELYWLDKPEKTERYRSRSPGIETYFGLSNGYDFRYYPSSAFQTPIYQLLRIATQITIDFILSFNNRAVECYVNSAWNSEVEVVPVVINEKCRINQYISARLWTTYRGTGPGSASLLASMHMALEKWLLAYAKDGPKEMVEKLCYYLVENSRSASVTAVVASVVMSQPSKLFNIAKMLFRTKEFFFYDTQRCVADQSAESLYSIGYGRNPMHRIHQSERIKTCNEKHRKKTLEHIALEYQIFKPKDINAEEMEARQKALWEIFDEYYKELVDKDEKNRSKCVWRLYLARMDQRKMNPEVKELEAGLLICLNPEIEPDLKKYSDEALQQSIDSSKFLPLSLWSSYRFNNMKDKYCEYQQYENSPELVITEVREIIHIFEAGTLNEYRLFNHSIPAYACTVLIRDFNGALSPGDIEFCKNVIMEFSELPLKAKEYYYQVSDGTQPAISALPYLYKRLYHDKEATREIKRILILLLLSNHMEISTFATEAILQNLWDASFEDAHSLFLGYLSLKPQYNDLADEVRLKNHQKGIYEISEKHIVEKFVEESGTALEDIILNRTKYDNIKDIQNMDRQILTRAFELLPLGTEYSDHMKFVASIFPVFAKTIFENNRYDRERFDCFLLLQKLAYFILTAKKERIGLYLQPFIHQFKVSENTAQFFEQFIFVEDRLNRYDEFWIVWNAFYEKIAAICKTDNHHHYTKGIIYNYLLAGPYWEENIKEWHSLKAREKIFFKKVSEDLGHFPPVLYSISKILNDIGSDFLEDGVLWLSDMLSKNRNLLSDQLEVNTIYYLENIVRKYILSNRQKIRTTLQIKQAVVNILNYLVARGSATGYLLRENIL